MNEKDKKKLLFVSFNLPYPLNGGGKIRSYYLLQSLAADFDITLFYYTDGDKEQDILHMRKYCQTMVGFQPKINPNRKITSEKNTIITRIKNIFTREPWLVKQMYYESVIENLLKLELEQFDFVFVSHIILLPYFYDLRKDLKKTIIVCDFHDIWSDVYRQGIKLRHYNGRTWRLWIDLWMLKRYEKKMMKAVSLGFVTSRDHRKQLIDKGVSFPVRILSNCIDFKSYECVDHLSDEEYRLDLLLIGNMGYGPNKDACSWFLDEIFRWILKRNSNVNCAIISDTVPDEIEQKIKEFKNIRLIRDALDIKPWLQKASLIIVPLRMGSGTRLKILEALALKKAIVSTSLGAEGLGLIHDEHIIIADESEQFANSCCDLISDERKRIQIGESGYQYAKQLYDVKKIQKDFIHFMMQMC